MFKDRLAQLGQLSDGELPIVQSLLLIGASEAQQSDIQSYEAHIVSMQDALILHLSAQPQTDHVLIERAKALHHIIHTEFGYRADIEEYNRMDHMNFLRVIERRKGIPVAMGALYLELAQRQGWTVYGLNFPAHFLVRLDHGAQRVIIDPYHGVIDLKASDMRDLVKRLLGPKAELHPDYYEPVSSRDVVLRFCNNRKSRLIQSEYYQEALNLIELERLIAPNEPRLLFDAGMVAMRVDRIQDALNYMELFIQHSKDRKTIAEARDIQRSLKQLLQ
jgi:regulator of sirC expression with transglutaminase-like and TPR domain